MSEMLGVAEEHIALAEKKFASTPQERKAKENTLMVWRYAINAIQVIQRKYENPFTTALAVRRDIPKLLKQRFEKKFANLSDAEKYNQAELQSDLNYAHRVNKAIEWVLKEKSKEADNTIADKAQPQQSTSEPVAAEQESTKTEEKPTSKTPLSEKLPDNSFMDKSLPVNTGVNARMVVIDKQESNNQNTDNKPKFSQSSAVGDRTITQVREKLVKHFGEKIISLLEKKGILKIHQSLSDESVPNSVKNGGSNTDGAYDEGVIHLIADNLTDETILGTFVHELGVHKGFQEMMSPKAYALIMEQFNRLVDAKNPIALAAKQRAVS